MKPHIYHWRGKWYCRRDYEYGYYKHQLGIAADSPVEVYRKASEYHHW